MFDALIAGQRDGQVLAELALGRLRKKIPALTEALVGRVDDHHAFLARMICDHIDTISRMIAELNARIEREIEPYRAEVELLDSLPGVDTRTAEVIIAEIGTDMSRFPIATRLASWAGACPATTRPAAKVNPATLAPATVGSKPPSASPRWARSHEELLHQRPVPPRCHSRGGKRAHVAVAHSLLVSAWHVLATKTAYHDLGGDYFRTRDNPDHQRRRAIAQLERLGYNVTVKPRAASLLQGRHQAGAATRVQEDPSQTSCGEHSENGYCR